MHTPRSTLPRPILRDRRQWGEARRWLGTTLVLAVLHVAAPVTAAPTAEVAWSEIARLRDQGRLDLAAERSRSALEATPRSVALLIQQAEILLARGGPRAAFAWVESLEAGGDARSGSIGRIALAPVDRTEGDAVRTAQAMLAEVEPAGLDAVLLSLHLAEKSWAGRSTPPSTATVDSLVGWAAGFASDRREDSTLASWTRAAFDALPARAALSRRDFHAAADRARQSRDFSARLGMTTLEMQQSALAGVICVRGGFPGEGIEDLERALRLAIALGDRHQQSLALSYLAFCHESARDTERALARYTEANHLLRALGNTGGLGWNLMGEGWIRWLRGEVDLAETILREGLEVFEETGDTLGQARALLNLGVVYVSTDRPDEALRVYERGLDLATLSDNLAERGRMLNNTANVHLLTGRAELALPLYQEALETARRAGNVEESARVLGNLALVSDRIGRTAQALAWSEEAIREAAESGNRALEAHLLAQHARRLNRAGRTGSADDALRRGFALAEGMDGWLIQGEFEETAGLIALARRDFAAGKIALRRANEVYAAQRHVAGRLRILDALAWCLAATGDLPGALERAREGEGLAADRGQTENVARYRGLQAQLQLRFGDPAPGMDLCRSAVTQAIRARLEPAALRSGQGGPGWHRPQVTAAAQLGIFVELAEATGALADSTFVDEAFQMLQRLKARTLLELIEPRGAWLQPVAPDSLLEELRLRHLELARSHERLAGEGSNALRLAQARALSRYDAIVTRLMESDPRYARANRRDVLDLPRVREHFLAARRVLLLDFLVPPRQEVDPAVSAWLFALDAGGLTVHSLGPVRELAAQIRFYLELVQGGQGTPEGIAAASRALSERLLGPVRDRLVSCDELVIVPDGAVHLVPFAALLHLGTADPVSPPLTIVPSLSVQHALEQRSRSAGEPEMRYDLAIWSAETGGAGIRRPGLPPLRHAPYERRALQRRFRSCAVFPSPAPDQSARDAIAEAGILGRARVVHFIAHGLFDDRRPWAGGLQLLTDRDDPLRHRLGTTDVYGMNFDAELVTLSACETARGEILVGEGMLGFAQALFGSGAQSVLATLWPVDDATSGAFMTAFYEELARGRSKAEALRNVQTRFAGDPRLSHPFHWAGYVLLGEGRSGIPLRTASPWLPALAPLGFALLLAFLALRIRSRS